jgi:excinuclease UvrABC nuclease subunit
VLDDLEKSMKEKAQALEFEQAQEIKSQIEMLQGLF